MLDAGNLRAIGDADQPRAVVIFSEQCAARSSKQRPVGAEGDGSDIVAMLDAGNLRAIRDADQPRGVVLASSGEQRPVGAEGNG